MRLAANLQALNIQALSASDAAGCDRDADGHAAGVCAGVGDLQADFRIEVIPHHDVLELDAVAVPRVIELASVARVLARQASNWTGY
jgi:hypothetical protein